MLMDTNGHTILSEDYCSYEVAQLLKEKGFDELCIFKYNSEGIRMKAGVAIDEWQNSELDDDECSCVSHQMAMKWLREVYKLEVRSTYDYDKDSWWGNINPMFEETDENTNVYQKALRFDYQGKSYEEAVEAALKYCLENLI